ncbi:MAG: ATP-binding protein [Legionellaceae bacterium]|nr:ATP-binding protein [Legionellaceae bacterium]
MLDLAHHFYSTKGFMPHGMCLLWTPSVLWTLVFSNSLISLSYLMIPFTLLYVYLKRKDFNFIWIFLLFGAFILFCGATHLLHVITYWNPIYGVQATVDLLTGIVSFLTAIVLIKLVPDLLKIPSPEELENKNIQLKNTLSDLSNSEIKYKSLVKSIQYGICSFKEDHTITYINTAGCKILGNTDGYITGKKINTIFPTLEQKKIDLSSDVHDSCTINITGHEKILDYYITKLPSEDSESEYIFSFNDITIFKSVRSWDESGSSEEKAIRTREMLVESQKLEALGRLAGGIAHDFNNNLAIINGSLELSKFYMSKDANKAQKEIQIAKEAVEASSSLIRQLLGFARQGTYEKGPININNILEQLNDFKNTILGSTKIKLNISEEKNLWSINGDKVQILQVFTNLLLNAKDAMPNEGEINIESRNIEIEKSSNNEEVSLKPGKYIKITINDTGTGIPQNAIKNIFDPFFSTKGVGKGTGLGLAMVHSTVSTHNGSIIVNSVEGEGTTFKLFFPALNDEKNKKNQSITKENKKGENFWSNKCILIADDEELIVDIVKSFFEMHGAKVIKAYNGQEAIDKYKKHVAEINLIILDLNMPVLDGVKSYKAIRKLNLAIPVLFSTGYSSDNDIQKIIKNDELAKLIQKPFDREPLLKISRELIKNTNH